MYRSLIVSIAFILAIASVRAQALPQTEKPAVDQKTTHEDWTTLSAEKSGLNVHAVGGPVLSKDEQPEFTREMVRLQWRSTDPIEVYVVRPHGVVNPPVILYLYNYTSDVDRFRDDGWCKRATQDGFAAVGFVSALAPQRFHTPRPMKQWFVSELQESLATSTHDVQMILNYLATRVDLDTKSVGMFGQGSGGAIAILATSVDPRITALDVIDPWGDWADWLKGSPQIPEAERPAYLTPDFLGKIAGLDPVTVLPNLKLPSLRVQQLLDDAVTPTAAKDRIKAAVRRPEDVTRYPSWKEHQATYRTSGLSGWLREQLKPSSHSTGPSGTD